MSVQTKPRHVYAHIEGNHRSLYLRGFIVLKRTTLGMKSVKE
jgi:hypothetical protein